uniref:Glycine N-acyltransferase-like protein n=1 Tax=Macaca fascicularis TaxID=9541 RepID=A0A7N9CH35_MACFA|nr:ciliary neurotrophic factor isoform X2 [Macaca nemestrina]
MRPTVHGSPHCTFLLLHQSNLILGNMCNQEMFKESSLDIGHAELVNQSWKFGGMERSLKFIHRCIQNFSNICLLGPVGKLVSWVLMDQTGESRMAGTGAKYGGKGLMTYVFYTHTHNIKNFNLLLYLHLEKINQIMIKTVLCMNYVHIPRTWNQWNCEPTDASSEMRTTQKAFSWE